MRRPEAHPLGNNQWRGSNRSAMGKSRSEASEETNSARTFTWDFQPPELWGKYISAVYPPPPQSVEFCYDSLSTLTHSPSPGSAPKPQHYCGLLSLLLNGCSWPWVRWWGFLCQHLGDPASCLQSTIYTDRSHPTGSTQSSPNLQQRPSSPVKWPLF